MELHVNTGSRPYRVVVTEGEESHLYRVEIDGRELTVDYIQQSPGVFSLLIDGISYEAFCTREGGESRLVVEGENHYLTVREAEGPDEAEGSERADGPAEIRSVIPGKVVACLVKEGQIIESGQGVVLVEAMKMENEIRSPVGGRVTTLAVSEGQIVEANAILARIEPELEKG